MNRYKLYIDESGNEHQHHQSDYYILIGCIIDTSKQLGFEERAKQIKYRYFKKTTVVFHSRQMARNEDDFAIFKDNEALKQEFRDDLLEMLGSGPIRVVCCVVDKPKVYAQKWKPVTLIEKTVDSLILDYLNYIYHKKPARGVIVFEASSYEKDAIYLKSFNKVLESGWGVKHPEFTGVREKLTSVTFATKLNHDIENQLADILSYAAQCKYRQQNGAVEYPSGSYEARLIDILNEKLLSPSTASVYAKNIVGFNTLPTPKL